MGALFNAAKFGLVRNSGLDVNQRGPSQWTALHQACFNGHTEIVELLLAHPAITVNLQTLLWHDCLFSELLLCICQLFDFSSRILACQNDPGR